MHSMLANWVARVLWTGCVTQGFWRAYLLLRSSRSAVSSAESSVSSSMAGDLDSDNCKSLVLRDFTSVAPLLLAAFTVGSSLLKLSWMGSLDLRGIGAWATGELAACATAAAAASASFTWRATRMVSSSCLLIADKSICVSVAPFCVIGTGLSAQMGIFCDGFFFVFLRHLLHCRNFEFWSWLCAFCECVYSIGLWIVSGGGICFHLHSSIEKKRGGSSVVSLCAVACVWGNVSYIVYRVWGVRCRMWTIGATINVWISLGWFFFFFLVVKFQLCM